jgi:hypothetical protein
MKQKLICLAFISLAWQTWAQHSVELEKRNGFKDIKLGSLVDTFEGAFVKPYLSRCQRTKLYSTKF